MSLAFATIPRWETYSKIKSFLNYPQGWRYGEGRSPRPETTEIALAIDGSASKDALETDAFLGTDSEVRVTVYYGVEYLQFTVDDDTGLIEYVRERENIETDRQVNLPLSEALDILENVKLEIWHSSASSTEMTTTTARDISKTSHSKLPDAEQVFQWLKRIAQSTQADRFART